MSLTRAALTITLALSVVAGPAASVDNVRNAAWPVDTGWSSGFPIGGELALVMGESRLFVVEPAKVSALAWTDGTERWTREQRATAPPVADEGRLFVAADDSVYSLSEVTGHEDWHLPVGAVSITPTARAGWLVVASDRGTLQGISTAQGRGIWQVELPAPFTVPAVIDGDLVVGACVDGRIRAWHILDGALRWTRDVGTRPAQLLAASGYVFIAGEDGRLTSLRQRDGRLNWAYPYGMAIVGRLAADSRHVFATTIDNSVHAHTFNGNQAWHQLLVARVVDGLVADTRHVFVPQSNGEIRMFLADSGAKAGRLSPSRGEANALGGLVAAGTGQQLRMAMTTSVGSRLAVTTYRRAGLGASPATSGPSGPPLELRRPGGRP